MDQSRPSDRGDEDRSDEGRVATGEALVRARLRALVREQPWLAVGAAAVAGSVLGGICFSRAGRLVFAATTGVALHELWHREGQLAVSDIVTNLSRDRAPRAPSAR